MSDPLSHEPDGVERIDIDALNRVIGNANLLLCFFLTVTFFGTFFYLPLVLFEQYRKSIDATHYVEAHEDKSDPYKCPNCDASLFFTIPDGSRYSRHDDSEGENSPPVSPINDFKSGNHISFLDCAILAD